ncbi:hypothetical protein V5799_027414 [Amblyomma americanum]|uniref:Monocarboxylate transporter n=1 Tax=Amblyomma americanum TaxID=6943 RepID=A0AAQ4DFS9_AMBAM
MLETTVVAYGIDKNAGTLNQCNLLQTFIAVGQLAGRLVVPLLSDKIPFSRCPFTAGSLALSAASLVLMSFTNDYIVLAALATFLGACQGFLLCIKAVLYADYLGVESLGLACGLQGLGMVPVLLSAPAAIARGKSITQVRNRWRPHMPHSLLDHLPRTALPRCHFPLSFFHSLLPPSLLSVVALPSEKSEVRWNRAT